MQVFKQFHKILLDIFNHMLPTNYTVKSLEPVLNCTEKKEANLRKKRSAVKSTLTKLGQESLNWKEIWNMKIQLKQQLSS